MKKVPFFSLPMTFAALLLTISAQASPVEKAQWPAFGRLAEQKGMAAQVPLLMPSMLTACNRAILSWASGLH